jgi:hypothetical protein
MKLGDLIYYITKYTGIKYLVELYYKGEDCGCPGRREKLNNLKSKQEKKIIIVLSTSIILGYVIFKILIK